MCTLFQVPTRSRPASPGFVVPARSAGGDAFPPRISLDEKGLDEGGTDPEIAPNPASRARSRGDRQVSAGQGTIDPAGAIDHVCAGPRPEHRPQHPVVCGRGDDRDLAVAPARLVEEKVLAGAVARRAPGRRGWAAGV